MQLKRRASFSIDGIAFRHPSANCKHQKDYLWNTKRMVAARRTWLTIVRVYGVRQSEREVTKVATSRDTAGALRVKYSGLTYAG